MNGDADGRPGRPVVAAFDFDGTLTTRDSVVPFLGKFLARPSAFGGVVRRAPSLAVAAARRDRDDRMAATRALLAGRVVADIERVALALAETVVAGRLRADTLARLGWHREQGHRVVVVSASYESYLIPVASRIGADAALGTRLEVDDAGRCTGVLLGRNCRGAEKVARLHAWLAEQGWERGDVALWAYGDSNGDRDLLADADHPVWVREPLTSVAAVPTLP